MRRSNKMSKKFSLIALAIIAILGSLVTIYACNLFFTDVPYFGPNIMDTAIFASFSALLFGAYFVMGALYICRAHLRPKTIKRLSSTYLKITIVLSALGFIFALLAGLVNYGTLLSKYPFPGFVIVAMVLHLLVLAASIFIMIKFVKPLPEDEEKFKVTAKHVFFTLGWFLFVALAFNRFGAFLTMPIYVELRNFYQTIFFYLFLLVPMAILVKKAFDVFELKLNRFIYVIVLFAVNLVLFLVVVIIGLNDTTFVSSLSPAMPLERLAAKPVEIIIHFASQFGILLAWLIREIKAKKHA